MGGIDDVRATTAARPYVTSNDCAVASATVVDVFGMRPSMRIKWNIETKVSR